MSEAEMQQAAADGQPALPWDEPGILVGVDGSRDSLDALRYAVELAPQLKLPVHALVVWDATSPLKGDQLSGELLSRTQADAKKVIAATRRELFPHGEPAWFTIDMQRGRPAFVLLAASAKAVMLVLGRRGHGGFLGLLLGSVTAVCVPRALCPVLVVPSAAAAASRR